MNNTEKLALICRGLVEIKGKELIGEITPETKLADAGLDSLDAIELQMWIEEQLGTEISEPASSPVIFKDLIEMF